MVPRLLSALEFATTNAHHQPVLAALDLMQVVSGNVFHEYSGGGVINVGGTVALTQSTISGNSAYAAGGVYNLGRERNSTLTLTQSTVSGNSATFVGGVANVDGTLTLPRTLVSGNLVSGNLVSGDPALFGREIAHLGSGEVSAADFNLFGFDGDAGVTGFSPGPTDVVPSPGVLLADILDPELAANGGPTLTHALVLGSPAVDAVLEGCPPSATDQRGVSRPQGVACDIGAVEVEVEVTLKILSFTATPTLGTVPIVGVPVAFAVTVDNPSHVSSVEWDFDGNGTVDQTTTTLTTQYTYATAGSFPAKVTVVDSATIYLSLSYHLAEGVPP
jgi:hypothetical protein